MAEERAPGFWHTVPGVLTAIAAVITAIGGLLAVLLQLGVIGGADEEDRPQATSTSSSSQEAAATASSASSAAAQPGKSWTDAVAVWRAKDGTMFRMPARTMGFCISSGAGLYVNQSQNVAFEKMTSIDIVRSDVALTPGGKATVRISLTSGEHIDGTIDAGCDFIGFPEAGRVNLFPDGLQKIEFVR